jgi:PAS domain S-box-containing protein
MQMLIEAVVDYAIFMLEPDGRVATWNSGAERIKGYTAQEIIGQHFSCFYSEAERSEGLPDRALTIAAKEGKYETEAVRYRKDGTGFHAWVVIDRILDEGGELVGFAKVTRDITERVSAQAKVNEMQQQLATSQKMEAIGQLSGGIAHDFNNLLMIIQGNIESAERHSKDLVNGRASLLRSLESAKRGAQRAAALTSRLLSFSRRQPLNPKPLDLDAFLVGSLDFIQRSLGETIHVERIAGAQPWPVEVDANHLDSALLNLAINARDAMPDGGKLTVETENVTLQEDYCRYDLDLSPGEFVKISISDTGYGMTHDVLTHAFEPFFTTKEVGQGTGLGLSQVYGFVKQSGGHVRIYSEPGLGTVVSIYLPRLISVDGQSKEDDEEIFPTGEQGETILVVEDDDDVRSYVCDVLRGLHYNVLSAPGAQGALSLLQHNQNISLLLSDVVMPGVDGVAIAKRAREIRPGLPVMLMTGYPRSTVVHKGLEDNVRVVQKPVSGSELGRCVRSLLDGC